MSPRKSSLPTVRLCRMINAQWRIALRGDEVPADMECIAERPDGTRFWFTPYPAVLRDAQGRIIGGINLLIDITDRKNAEMEANEQFRTIVETTPECVKIVAPDGTLLFMNPLGLGDGRRSVRGGRNRQKCI